MDGYEYSRKWDELDRAYNDAMIKADLIDNDRERHVAYAAAHATFSKGHAELNRKRGV